LRPERPRRGVLRNQHVVEMFWRALFDVMKEASVVSTRHFSEVSVQDMLFTEITKLPAFGMLSKREFLENVLYIRKFFSNYGGGYVGTEYRRGRKPSLDEIERRPDPGGVAHAQFGRWPND
jgi:hypothetical protein